MNSLTAFKKSKMESKNKIRLFLVDDDAIFLKLLEVDFLQLGDFTVETFSSGEQCIANLSSRPDVIILDYHLHLDEINNDAMNGIETLDKIKAINADMPVIILSAQDKIEVAVNCLHHHAADYVVKSETAFMRLQKIIGIILSQRKLAKQLSWYMDRM